MSRVSPYTSFALQPLPACFTTIMLSDFVVIVMISDVSEANCHTIQSIKNNTPKHKAKQKILVTYEKTGIHLN